MIYIIIIVLLLFFLYMYLLAPSKPDAAKTSAFLNRNFAHRGLYTKDQSIAENTIQAFSRAAEAGYGIELDIRFSKDNQIVVFHDDTLARAANIDKPVDNFTYSELALMPLYGTDARMPLFQDVLTVINGRVPLIIELKAGKQNDELAKAAYEMLRQYTGPYGVESFAPRIIRWFKKNAPEIYRGQLACSVQTAANGTPKTLAFLASRCLLNCLSRPNFIAYELVKKPVSVRLAERLGAIPVCWTSHSSSDRSDNQMVIFEFYEPGPRF